MLIIKRKYINGERCNTAVIRLVPSNATASVACSKKLPNSPRSAP